LAGEPARQQRGGSLAAAAAVVAEAAARQHSSSLGSRSGSLAALAVVEAWWQQLGGGGSMAAAAAAAQQCSGSLGGNGRGQRQLGDRGVLAAEEAWRVLQRQRCCGKCGGGSMAAVQRQRQRSGGGSAAVVAAWRCWHCSAGSVAVAAAAQQQRQCGKRSGQRGTSTAAAATEGAPLFITIMLQWNSASKHEWEEMICVTFRKIISVSVIFKKYTSLASDIKNVHVASV
jgi:hypothetical protein